MNLSPYELRDDLLSRDVGNALFLVLVEEKHIPVKYVRMSRSLPTPDTCFNPDQLCISVHLLSIGEPRQFEVIVDAPSPHIALKQWGSRTLDAIEKAWQGRLESNQH